MCFFTPWLLQVKFSFFLSNENAVNFRLLPGHEFLFCWVETHLCSEQLTGARDIYLQEQAGNGQKGDWVWDFPILTLRVSDSSVPFSPTCFERGDRYLVETFEGEITSLLKNTVSCSFPVSRCLLQIQRKTSERDQDSLPAQCAETSSGNSWLLFVHLAGWLKNLLNCFTSSSLCMEHWDLILWYKSLFAEN